MLVLTPMAVLTMSILLLLGLSPSDSILNGTVVTRHGAFPYMISLRTQGKAYCSAALIEADVAVTAGSCLELGFRSLRAVIGVNNVRARNAIRYPIINAIRHLHYNVHTLENNIALLKFGQSFPQTQTIRTIPRAQPGQQLEPGTMCWFAGWGLTHFIVGRESFSLRFTKLPIMAPAVCNDTQHYNGDVLGPAICAGFEDGHTDGCQSDGGGPLICADENGRSTTYGIASWGKDCGKPRTPQVFVDIAAYAEWINATSPILGS